MYVFLTFHFLLISQFFVVVLPQHFIVGPKNCQYKWVASWKNYGSLQHQ